MTKPTPGLTARCAITRVVDGDTLEIELRFPCTIRMDACWAPESRTKNKAEKQRGIASKEHLTALAQGKHGLVSIPTGKATSLTDILTLGRVLGYVWIDGVEKDLSTIQVEAGYATREK